MRALDHFDAPEPRPHQDTFGCDRCIAVEMERGEFFVCEQCSETLCPDHADKRTTDNGRRICGDCYEGGPR